MSDEIKTEEKKRRGGRKPMTAEEKEAAAKLRAAEKAKAENLKPSYILQYQGEDVDLDAIAEAAKAAFKAEKKRSLVTDLKIYLKPEERAAYYVINGSFSGKLEMYSHKPNGKEEKTSRSLLQGLRAIPCERKVLRQGPCGTYLQGLRQAVPGTTR